MKSKYCLTDLAHEHMFARTSDGTAYWLSLKGAPLDSAHLGPRPILFAAAGGSIRRSQYTGDWCNSAARQILALVVEVQILRPQSIQMAYESLG